MTDISAYLEHIGYQGPRQPTREAFHELHVKHTRSIPFENLSPLMGQPIKLDSDALMDKFTRQRRGGYCYEHNLLFQHVLQVMGFSVEGLAARVRMNVPDEVETPRSHMLLLVEAAGDKFIADTGFGGLTLTAPIRFVADQMQETPHGPYRLMRKGEAFSLQTRPRNDWQELYVFDLTRCVLQDYEVFNWYTSTHPSSFFVNDLVAARPVETGRHALYNRQYSFYHLDGRTEKKQLNSVGQVREVLENEFAINTSDIPKLDSRLSEILGRAVVAS